MTVLTAYVWAILKSKQLMLLITGILATLYTFIFVILQLQVYTLLIGSIGIFIILGLVMYFPCKNDWNSLSLEE
ncbi:MAG: inner membrane protein [Sphingobacteriales bacterium]|jgi:inner membrane protein